MPRSLGAIAQRILARVLTAAMSLLVTVELSATLRCGGRRSHDAAARRCIACRASRACAGAGLLGTDILAGSLALKQSRLRPPRLRSVLLRDVGLASSA